MSKSETVNDNTDAKYMKHLLSGQVSEGRERVLCGCGNIAIYAVYDHKDPHCVSCMHEAVSTSHATLVRILDPWEAEILPNKEVKSQFAPKLADGSYLTVRMERTKSVVKALRLSNLEDIQNIVNKLYTGTEDVEYVSVRVTYEEVTE